jgi:hypothetical protein
VTRPAFRVYVVSPPLQNPIQLLSAAGRRRDRGGLAFGERQLRRRHRESLSGLHDGTDEGLQRFLILIFEADPVG